VTLTINILILKCVPYLTPRVSVHIRKFGLWHKTLFEWGDVEYCIVLNTSTSIEQIEKVFSNIHLSQDTRRVSLTTSEVTYPVGSIVVIVLFYRYNNNQYELFLENGQVEQIKAIVTGVSS